MILKLAIEWEMSEHKNKKLIRDVPRMSASNLQKALKGAVQRTIRTAMIADGDPEDAQVTV
jgi:hypothetical protein